MLMSSNTQQLDQQFCKIINNEFPMIDQNSLTAPTNTPTNSQENASANSPRHLRGKMNFRNTNRPLKRLNRNLQKNKSPQNHRNKQQNRNRQPKNFLDALSEYKKARNLTSQQNPVASTSKVSENQENIKSFDKNYQSITVISDDNLEDGEIIEEHVSHYASLIADSFHQVEQSKKLIDSNNQPFFYVDKSAESTNKSEVPLYNSRSVEAMEIDDSSVIYIDSSHSDIDDSVIIIDSTLPAASSTLASENDFISLSPLPSVFDSKSKKEQRKEKQKARFKNYKQKKMVEKVLELQSNGLLDGIAIKIPSATLAQQKPTQSDESKAPEQPKPTEQSKASEAAKKNEVATPSGTQTKREKRIILIDGSNVAMGYTASNIGKKAMVNSYKDFSAEALKKVITYFEQKEFQVKAIVPEFRVRRDKSSNHELMVEMLDSGKLITTPAKSYDDRILLQSAAKLDAAIVSNDLFRDVRNTNGEFKEVIEKRQIRYNWIFGELILAEDPNGRAGPKLEDILFKSS